jgi:hypothetical protein
MGNSGPLMARRPTARRRLEQLADRFEPEMQAAFLAAIADIVSGAELGRITERLERGDINGALRALHIDPAAFREFEEAIRQAYIAGGVATTEGFPPIRDAQGNRVVFRFNARNPRAERILTLHSGQLITRITDDMLLASRQAMTAGLEAGLNPRSVALDLVGRIDRTTGRRTGGILGLTSNQERYVTTARFDLLSGDPERLRHYLTLNRRDRRFDRTVLAAIRDGKALDQATVSRITGRLSDSYLQLRGETLARTETIGSLNTAAKEAVDQMAEESGINRQDIRKVWRATKDSRTRDTHAALDGESVGVDERFSNGLLYPGEPGGDPAEVINCRCIADYRVDFLSNLR